MHIFHWFPFSPCVFHTQRNNVTDIFTFYSFGFFFVYNLFAFESLDIKHLRSYKYMRECMWYVMCIQCAYSHRPILATTRHACVCFYVSIIAVVSVTVLRIKIFFDSLAHNNNLLKSFFQIYFLRSRYHVSRWWRSNSYLFCCFRFWGAHTKFAYMCVYWRFWIGYSQILSCPVNMKWKETWKKSKSFYTNTNACSRIHIK